MGVAVGWELVLKFPFDCEFPLFLGKSKCTLHWSQNIFKSIVLHTGGTVVPNGRLSQTFGLHSSLITMWELCGGQTWYVSCFYKLTILRSFSNRLLLGSLTLCMSSLIISHSNSTFRPESLFKTLNLKSEKSFCTKLTE